LSPFLDLVSGQKKLSLVFVVVHVGRPTDQNLLDARHRQLRFLAKYTDMQRHFPPTELKELARGKDVFYHRLRPGLSVSVVVWQKHRANRQIGIVIKRVSQAGDLTSKNLVR